MAYRNRCKSHDVTLVAFAVDAEGTVTVIDIVETSRAFAPSFMRRFYRSPDVTEVAACKPGTLAQDWRLHSRTIYR